MRDVSRMVVSQPASLPMSHRATAWMIFLGFLALIGAGAALGVGNRAVQYGIWGFWLVEDETMVLVLAESVMQNAG